MNIITALVLVLATAAAVSARTAYEEISTNPELTKVGSIFCFETDLIFKLLTDDLNFAVQFLLSRWRIVFTSF